MVILNECRINPEGKCLIIDASVENLSYYRDVYIDSVIVDTEETFTSNGPSSNPIYTQTFEPENLKVDVRKDCNALKVDSNCECGDVYTSQKAGVKNIRVILTKKDLKGIDFNSHIFFVYIVATGVPSSCTPCGMDNSYTMGIAINLRPIYNMIMQYIKELDSNCIIPKGFIDMILRLKAFKIALKTGNYDTAFKYWNKFFNKKTVIPTTKRCGCHGII